MELHITHHTTYTFSQAVFLEPHLLRFQPRADGAQLPLEFELHIDPAPAGHSSWLDASGNTVTQAWFDGLHESLAISAHARVRTLRDNPFDYLLDVRRTRLPVFYGSEAPSLVPYFQRAKAPDGARDEVAVLAARMRHAGNGELIQLLTALNNTLYERLTVIRRDEGEAWAPEHTWHEGCGACRDLAVLFVDACRALGVAARFVSGYEDPCPANERCDLHAWAEVYIPGGGWRGYDPSRGLAVADNYVAVAAADDPMNAGPVTGAFRGTGVASKLVSDIYIERVSQVADHEDRIIGIGNAVIGHKLGRQGQSVMASATPN